MDRAEIVTEIGRVEADFPEFVDRAGRSDLRRSGSGTGRSTPTAPSTASTTVVTSRSGSSPFPLFIILYFRVMTVPVATLSHTAALARLGRALSDPTRAGILLALREAPGYPSDLADALEVSRQVMSNHLACLRGCGLVEAVPDGRRSWYRLTDPHLAPAFDELLRVVLFVEPDCCDGDGCSC
jgi:DNA-binding transcriptional ArsR family regulator